MITDTSMESRYKSTGERAQQLWMLLYSKKPCLQYEQQLLEFTSLIKWRYLYASDYPSDLKKVV